MRAEPNVNCSTCGKSFHRHPSDIKTRNFCSRPCWYLYRYNVTRKDGQKLCARCKQWKPETKFSINKARIDGLDCYCKKCVHDDRYKKEYNIRDELGRKFCTKCKQWLPETEYNGRSRCKKCILQEAKDYYWKAPEIHNEKSRRYYRVHADELLRKTAEYHRTEKGKEVKRKTDAKRKKYGYIQLWDTPFSNEIKTGYHHINNMLVVPMPERTHRICNRNDADEHRRLANKWIEKLYCIDLKIFIGENESMKEGNMKRKEKTNTLPWCERYRANTWADVVGQDEAVNSIRKQLKNLPHMLFTGTCGSGKTTLAEIIIQELGVEALRLNGSEDNGVDIVRGVISTFVKHKSLYNKAPFKLIFIDEADALSEEMQKALRSRIETWTFNTRWLLCCNYESKIIEPLMSRFQVYRFRPIGEEAMVKRLRVIADAEEVDVSDDSLLEVSEMARGDMRKAINMLQRGNYSKAEEGRPVDELDKIFAVARA